ncbi:lanC-like protein GCR2-like, partial [Trifolium medium]|nr:lanC-like protein GCR2-like [Trifolium medium]
SSGNRVKDYTLYTGVLGTAYLVFKAYQVTKNVDDLNLCLKIVKACDSASANSSRVTFICGRAGVCALGAVIAKHAGDERLLDYYLRQFKE